MALSHAIMTALIDDDMSGYELAKSFDASLGFFWQASHQQIYQDLRKLSEKGWLSKREVSQVQEGKDDLFVKLYNLGEHNVTHLMAEIDQRRKSMMQRLYLYEKIRRAHYGDPELLPIRRQGVYLALLGGIRKGEQFMQWCDEALELLAKVESTALNLI